MSNENKKKLFYLSWLGILAIGPITVFSNSSSRTFSDPALLINFFQRLTGLLGFSLFFIQIIFGAFMKYWARFVGGSIHKFHITQGLLAYAFFLGHPMLYVVFNYKTLGKVTLFLLPNLDINTPLYELYLSYGRISLLLVTIGVFAAYFRTKPFMRKHWRKAHILNYFAFYFTALHAWGVGTDVRSVPFVWLFWVSLVVVSGTVFLKLIYPRLAFLTRSSPAETEN